MTANDASASSGRANVNPRLPPILEYWRSIELFDAQKLNPPDARERRYEARPGQPLPWQTGHPLRRERLREGLQWRHTVFGGVFAMDKLHATLERVFGDSGHDVAERIPRGFSALFAVVVTEDGRLLVDSLVLSTAAWALGRALSPGPDADKWLDGFRSAAYDFAMDVHDWLAPDDDDEIAVELARNGVLVSRPVGQSTLLSLVSQAAERLGVQKELSREGLRIHSERIGRKRAHDTQVDFLNSFFVEDLRRTADAVAAGDCGPALRTFLTAEEELPAIARLDVRDQKADDTLMDLLAPASVPAGRWPAKVSHSLATSQQLAINAIMRKLSGQAGIFAVNGPPGTGKTTMLRDLVAAIVVERAVRLAHLANPADAFDGRSHGSTDGGPRRSRLREELTGFEIVVASANNEAVANVTREIPQLGAIDQAWAGQAGYFADHATRVLGEAAWGMVAAQLGNRTNCSEFVNRFWWGESADPAAPIAKRFGFQNWLEAPVLRTGPADWSTAVSAFRRACAAEQSLRQARQAAHDALRQLPALRHAQQVAQAAWHSADRAHRTADAQAQQAEQAAAAAQKARHDAHARRQEHRAVKPGVWEMLFTFGRAIRQWHREDLPLAAALQAAEAAAGVAVTGADASRRAATQREHQAAIAAAESDRAAGAVATAERIVAQARQDFGARVPDDDWRADTARRELTAPWLDDAWNEARTKVFLAALDLHAAFVAGAATIIRPKLRTAMDALIGQAKSTASEAVLREAWQSLFLVVPVVSTTFASVSRLLGRLDSQALGWLLIDEAGQAPPQAAVGAIWRAQRVIAVGDPLQLEPVVTVLHTTQAALARHHGVAETWLPGSTSVQGLADRVTDLGTWLPGPDDEPVWVGAPLRVHRRCDNPMFTIVNSAVYANLMIYGTPARDRPLAVTDSAWIDVAAAEAEGHWIPAEGDAVLRTLEYLQRQGVELSQVIAVSPFRDTARQLRRLLARRGMSLVQGTVHTAQGKEADAVLFVLGGNAAKPGALRWAASRPNLFNVAVSRARQRLYVIGNHGNWARLPYFSILARELPIRPLRGADERRPPMADGAG